MIEILEKEGQRNKLITRNGAHGTEKYEMLGSTVRPVAVIISNTTILTLSAKSAGKINKCADPFDQPLPKEEKYILHLRICDTQWRGLPCSHSHPHHHKQKKRPKNPAPQLFHSQTPIPLKISKRSRESIKKKRKKRAQLACIPKKPPLQSEGPDRAGKTEHVRKAPA